MDKLSLLETAAFLLKDLRDGKAIENPVTMARVDSWLKGYRRATARSIRLDLQQAIADGDQDKADTLTRDYISQLSIEGDE